MINCKTWTVEDIKAVNNLFTESHDRLLYFKETIWPQYLAAIKYPK